MNARRILICDDDTDILEMLNLLLTDAGYEVLTARGYREVIEHMKKNPDLILLDIRLPDMDGYNIAESLRMQGHKLPIIFMSAYATSTKSVISRSAHSSGFFSKPFDPSELLQKVDRVLRQQGDTVPA